MVEIQTRNQKTDKRLDEILDDLCMRFILNSPEEDFESVERLFFHVEEAHWFYTDFYVENAKRDRSPLPNLSFPEFAEKLFNHCPLLAPHKGAVHNYTKTFLNYKTKVPVYGAVLVNKNFDKVVLIKSYYSDTWSFPRGKIAKDETELACAIREVKEEIGYDATALIREQDVIEQTIRGQKVKLFIVAGVPENTTFATQTRKEVRSIKWHRIDSVPHSGTNARKFFMAAPFMKPLAAWIRSKKTQSPPNMLASAVVTPVPYSSLVRRNGFSTPERVPSSRPIVHQPPYSMPPFQQRKVRKTNKHSSPPKAFNLAIAEPKAADGFSFSFDTDAILSS